MSAADYLHQMLPEAILLAGAAVTLLARGAGSRARPTTPALLALVTVVFALGVSLWRGDEGMPAQLPGLLLSSLTFYVRVIGLGVGLLILLANWYVPEPAESGEFFSMILFSLAGLLLTAASNDLVVLFFAIELVSVPTYILIALSRLDSRASEACVKYFFLGAAAAAVMVYGFSFLYGVSGSTVLRDGLSGYVAEHGLSGYAMVGLLLVMAGFFFKTAAVPFHFYAPDVYEGAASPITALLGFLPKLAGFVGLIQIFSAVEWALPDAVRWTLWCAAVLSMTVGNVLALLQSNVKRMLAYSSIAHTGYMLIGLLVGPTGAQGPMGDGVAALLFYVAVYGVMNLGAFAVLASLETADGPVEQIHELHGLSVQNPAAALVMAVCMFSLMGIPPTAGFVGKVYIFSGALSANEAETFYHPLIALAVIGVINSAVAAAYYLRVAAACYLGDEQTETRPVGGSPMRLTLSLCGLALVVVFAWSAPLSQPARLAARRPMLRAQGLVARAQPDRQTAAERVRDTGGGVIRTPDAKSGASNATCNLSPHLAWGVLNLSAAPPKLSRTPADPPADGEVASAAESGMIRP